MAPLPPPHKLLKVLFHLSKSIPDVSYTKLTSEYQKENRESLSRLLIYIVKGRSWSQKESVKEVD